MEYVGGGSVSSLLRNPDCGPVRGEVREDLWSSEGRGEGGQEHHLISHHLNSAQPYLIAEN